MRFLTSWFSLASLFDGARARTFVALAPLALFGAACGSATVVPAGTVGDAAGNADASVADGAPGFVVEGGFDTTGAGETSGACVNLQCKVHSCTGGGATTVSGAVFDPALKNPLYDVVVYVPNAPLAPLPTGASCDACGALYSGQPIAVALTDSAGNFTLKNVPDGDNVPIVVQVGKWRQELVIPHVEACKDNPQPNGSLHLPGKQSATGNIPRIAISTGRADTLECLLHRIGLDSAEYGGGASGTGRLHIFEGGTAALGGVVPNTSPPGPKSADALWSSKDELMTYDIVLLSCEGKPTTNMNQQALHDYASAGGRVFASHFHYAWFDTGPYGGENLASWHTGSQDISDINAVIRTDFPKGKALHEWLGTVGALTADTLPITQARHNANVLKTNTPSQSWIVADSASPSPGATEYFSFDTPTDAPIGDAGVPNYCGRVVYSDLHVGGASSDDNSQPVPAECADGDLSPQEKALEFMLFDLSSCVVPDGSTPVPPEIPGIH